MEFFLPDTNAGVFKDVRLRLCKNNPQKIFNLCSTNLTYNGRTVNYGCSPLIFLALESNTEKLMRNN